ncbi:MAG: hypothetical protein P1U50_06505 [Parvibaculaceae bacterium]|nr:hypothetical protein [Parvibaculaceae bacterium]
MTMQGWYQGWYKGTLKAAALSGVIAISACATPPAPTTALEMTFQHRPVISLNVARMEVVDAYDIGGSFPRVDHLYTKTPASLVHQWAQDRLKPVGQMGQVSVLIQEAKVVETSRLIDKGFLSLFNDEPDTDLTATITARIEFVNVLDGGSYAVDVNAHANVAIFESATLNERDLAYYSALETLGAAFDEAVEKELRSVMKAIIVP